MSTRSIPTKQGQRTDADVVQELFVLARAAREQMTDGVAFVSGERDGEQIEIRVTVKSHNYARALKAALDLQE